MLIQRIKVSNYKTYLGLDLDLSVEGNLRIFSHMSLSPDPTYLWGLPARRVSG